MLSQHFRHNTYLGNCYDYTYRQNWVTYTRNLPCTPCKNSKTKKQYSFHGESLKSRLMRLYGEKMEPTAVSETSSVNSPRTPCQNPKTKKQLLWTRPKIHCLVHASPYPHLLEVYLRLYAYVPLGRYFQVPVHNYVQQHITKHEAQAQIYCTRYTAN